jgi:protein-S-isoprenylcysteine O-methyltransferase Ste14
MAVIIVYVALVAIGEVLAFFLAQAFDAMVPAAWSMIFYMALFFGVIWGAWPIAVAITEKWLVRSENTAARQASRG